jgi:hypothetical protein
MTTVSAPAATQQNSIADQMFDAVFDHCLDFRIEMEYDAARRFIQRIDRYNDFDARQVLDALDAVDRLIPRDFYGEGNPNNGQRKYRISVGREGSPVLYLEWYESPYSSGPRISDETLKDICKEIEVFAYADEADYDLTEWGFNSRKVSLRFWWD